MSKRFEELDWRETPIGAISLRRRIEPSLQVEIFEVKLDDEYLMSSLFTVAEIELARLGLAAVDGADLDVVVGGLGLGYTGRAVLDDARVRSLLVVELLDAVIDWHRDGLLPLATELVSDPRTRLISGDFFAMAESAAGFDEEQPGRVFDAILLDIDHAPDHVLDEGHAAFYGTASLSLLRNHLRPGGVFALWSDNPPDDRFTAALAEVFGSAEAHVVSFANPLRGGSSSNTVYVAHPQPRG